MAFFSDSLLAGKVALITGGGTGLGLAMARAFGAVGAKLVIASRSSEHVEEGAESLRAAGVEVLPLVCDVRDPDQVETRNTIARISSPFWVAQDPAHQC